MARHPPASGEDVGDDTLAAEPARASDAVDVTTVLDQAVLDEWLAKLQGATLFAFDTETTSLNYMVAEVVGVSFAVEAGAAAYVPLAHDYPGAPDQLNREAVLEALKPLLEDEQVAKVGQHLKYDANVLANHGITLRGIHDDTMLESYVLDAAGSRHDLDTLALKYLGQRTIHFEDIAGKGAKQLTFNQVPIEQAAPYAAEDAEVTLRLHQLLSEKLDQEPALATLYRALKFRWSRSYRGLNATAPWFVATHWQHTAKSWVSVFLRWNLKRTSWRVDPLIWVRQSSSVKFFSINSNCRFCERHPRARHRRQRTFSRSWPSTIRCRQC